MAPVPTLSFSTVLITGGAVGLGRAMAEYLISQKKKVILAGRNGSLLRSTSSEIGAAGYYVLDTGNLSSIPDFVKTLTREHPDLDCLINNAGVQRPFQVMGPTYDFDQDKRNNEININLRGPMRLSLNLLPHLNERPNGGVIMNVSSVLGFVPTSLINPAYNGSKAWLHFLSMNLRSQLELEGSKVKVVEIVPPSVAPNLHRERADPDDNKKTKGNKTGLTIKEFMEEVAEGWKNNLDTVTAGAGKDIVEKWFDTYGGLYGKSVHYWIDQLQ
ncbi:MAG: hypothetical protein Q9227_003604 [Pyrenula ochraceoflavens]